MVKKMKLNLSIAVCAFMLWSCSDDDGNTPEKENETFSKVSSISLGEGVGEISAYDKETKQLFVVNTTKKAVDVIDLSNPETPVNKTPISVTNYGGNLNSVDVKDGKLAIAVEGNDKSSDKGKIVVFNTSDLTKTYGKFEAGYLPDMVKFTPDGKYILSANEGEPNDDNTVDPEGSISIVDINAKTISTIDFKSFNSKEADLEKDHFRVFGETNGEKNNLAQDVEPEYIAISKDSKTAWVSLQENNGLAKVDIASKTITEIYPLGVKDYSLEENKFDFSDKDDKVQWINAPVKSYFQPDAIDYFEVGQTGYIITANEGDSRDYDGFSEEERVDDLDLDPTKFPEAATLQLKENLGRLKITTAYGDTDNDGDYDELFGYGARSFSIFDTNGNLVFDSGNMLGKKSDELGNYPDKRSDDKGVEPEAVITYSLNQKVFAAIGLERSGDVLIYDITDVNQPVFVQNLENTSPEGLLIVSKEDSPNGKTLLIVCNEHPDDATVNVYSN